MRIVILYSSGLDSRIMLHYAKVKHPEAEIKCIYYAHGAESEQAEIDRLPDFVEVRKIDWLNDKIKPVAKKEDPFAGAIYIPGRNLVFATLAACQELANEIWMGTLVDEVNPKGTDKNDTFRHLASGTISYALSPFIDWVTVRFPFAEAEMTKADAVCWALLNGMTPEEILDTTSCWHRTGDLPCGQCKQCFKRALVLKMNDLSEECEIDPLDSDYGYNLAKGYLDEVIIKKSDNADEMNVVKMLTTLENYSRLPDRLQKLVSSYTYDTNKCGDRSL